MEEFEQLYMERFWTLQRYQWENYIDGAHHDLCAVDDEIFRLVASYKDTVELPGRRGKVVRDMISRELVDKHPEVSRLRNRVDDYWITSRDLSEEQRRDRMTSDVLELMRIRDRLARDEGFSSYVDLVLSTEGLELEWLISFLEGYLESNLPVARQLVKKYEEYIPPYEITYKDLDSRALLLIHEFLDRMGFSPLKDTIHIVWDWDDSEFEYSGILSPDDIRIRVPPTAMFHELGHAISHSLNTEVGVFKTWTAVYNESMAEVIGLIADFMLLDQAGQEAKKEGSVSWYTQLATSARFEFALWEHPEEAESLYTQHYRQLGGRVLDGGVCVVGGRVFDPSLWALDSFRSLDPVYIHNYIIGSVVAEKTVEFLKDEYGTDFQAWGNWLERNYFSDGRRRSLQEKTEVIGGFI